MRGYIDFIYDEKAKPYGKYPSQLCKYLFDRFAMKKGDKLLDVGCGRGDFLKGFNILLKFINPTFNCIFPSEFLTSPRYHIFS